MTEAEAIIVARIANHADGGCSTCASTLIEMLVIQFPEHAETFVQEFADEHCGGKWDQAMIELDLPEERFKCRGS